MAEVKIPDAAGNNLTLLEWEGELYPNFNPECITSVKSLQLRDDDILICSYPKSGAHWMFEICRMLKNGRIDLENVPKAQFMMEFMPNEDLDREPSPRILNTHYRFRNLPEDVIAKKPKIIYIRRNPKDVSASLYNHTRKLSPLYDYQGEFKDYLELFVDGKVDYGSWFDYVLEWERAIAENTDLSVLDVAYEDLRENPVGEIERISDFLGVERNEDLILSIKDNCNYEAMKERFKGHVSFLEDKHKLFYSKGDVGDWKNWYTISQNELFNVIYQKKMFGSKLQFKYT